MREVLSGRGLREKTQTPFIPYRIPTTRTEVMRAGSEREIGVYWYLFSNHYSLRCIYVERKQRKRAQLLLGVLELYKSSLLLAFSCFAR